jgi:FkbH-like protein/non-ribosomal peptide synthase protein (TIGR01720 family)
MIPPISTTSSAHQNQKLSVAYGGTKREDVDTPSTLPEALVRAAQQEETGITYLLSDGAEIRQSYAALRKEAEQILAGLRARGLKPGDIVMLQVEEIQHYLPTFWACVLGGLIVAPISIASSYAQATVTTVKLQKAWELCNRPLIVASTSLAPALRNLAPTLGMNDLQIETIETLLLQTSEVPECSWHHSKAEDVFMILFTSGSTGIPKGVTLTHRNVLSMIAGYTQLEKLTSQEVTFNWMPLDHIGGLVAFHLRDVYLICQQIHTHPSTILQDPLRWLDCLDHYHATCTWAPNFAFGLINEQVASIAQRQWDLSSLHHILDAGEAIVPKTAHRFLELLAPYGLASNAIHPSWGMSETSAGVTFSSNFSLETTTDEDRFVDVGALIPEVWVRIVNEHNQLVPEGKNGRVQVQGPTVTPGYFHQAGFNQQAFTPDGWFDTGDMGTLCAGRLTITGRDKHIIIINGLNYVGQEIEAVVEEVADIAVTYTGACAVRCPGDNTDELAIFYHSLHTAEQQILRQREAILQHVVKAVGIAPNYLIPLEKEAIPKTETGKIQRTRLKQQFEDGVFDSVIERLSLRHGGTNESDMPGIPNEVEQRLIRLWQKVLKHQDIRRSDHFFALGGHSLTLMELLSQIQEEFQVQLAAQHIFDYPTVAALAQRIEVILQTEEKRPFAPLFASLRTGNSSRVEAKSGLLSFAQERQWFLHQLDPDSPKYNVSAAFHLQGALNSIALEQSLQEIVKRHDVLRTTFVSVDGKPRQRVAASLTLSLSIRDLQHLPMNERLAEAQHLAAKEGELPFDLVRGPIIRTCLFVLAPDEHLLLISIHHIACDGWSMGIFMQELWELYTATSCGTPPHLPGLSIQYADYAHWQRQWMQDNELQNLLAYWKSKLEGAPTALTLPTDNPRPRVRRFQGTSTTIWFSQELSRALHDFSSQQDATLFMTMLTALNILLFQWTSQSDMVVGTVVADRRNRETEKLIGCFTNFLALRSQFSPHMTGLELLHEVKRTVIGAHTYQSCPFEKLVAALNPSREANSSRLYNIAFLLQNFPFSPQSAKHIAIPASPENDTLQFSFVPLDRQSVLLDMRLIAEETPEGICLECEYDTDLFKAETVKQVLESYTHILEMLVKFPVTTVASFSMIPQLEAQVASAKKQEEKRKIAITATFTADPLKEALAFWIQEMGWPLTISFAPYNQLFQQLLDPNSQLSQNRHGINIILLRLEDWLRFDRAIETTDQLTEKIEYYVDEFKQALRMVVQRVAVPYLVYLCPPSPLIEENPVHQDFLARMENRLAADLAALSQVFLVKSAELKSIYPVPTTYDPYADEAGHIPFTPYFFAALGTHIARIIYALHCTPSKVIVIDCDQTLWQGVCAEEGVQGVVIDAPRKALQKFLLAQQKAGMLLCLCSKNNQQDVFEVLDHHPDMLLKREHFAAWRINWDSKAQNLQALAEELRLSLDSFIFIDDNPLECAEVQAICPEVLTFPLPQDINSLPQALRHFWAFDHLTVTDEDRKRTEFYQHQLQRQALQQASATIEDFLADLKLQVLITPAEKSQLPRIAQLTQRTNQFNCSTIRRTESDLQQFCLESGANCLVVNVSDRFGDYSLVGVILFTDQPGSLEVDTFLLSCRVLGRGVEHQMLARLGQIAYERQQDFVRIRLIPTPRNTPASEFLTSIGTTGKKSHDGGSIFEFPAKTIMKLTYHPLTEKLPDNRAVANNVSSFGNRAPLSQRFQASGACLLRIVTELSTVEQVLNEIDIQQRQIHGRRGEAEKTAPRTETEKRLVEIWAETLKLDVIGIHDNFFALGGDSLLSIQVISKARQAGIQITVQELMAFQTIAELAAVAGATFPDQIEQSIITGPIPLIPIQYQFFCGRLYRHDKHHANIARMIEVAPDMLDPILWRRAVEFLLVYHDMLRARFVQDETGLREFVAVPDAIVPFTLVDLSSTLEGEQRAILELCAGKFQTSLNLSEGPILQVVLFTLGQGKPGRLLFIVHHQVTDAFSLSVLLEDLYTVYGQLSCGDVIHVRPKTTSYKQWIECWVAHAQSAKFHQELDNLLSLPWSKAVPLPLDYPAGKSVSTMATLHEVTARLSPEETALLLQKVQANSKIQLIEMLLTALVYTLSDWVGWHPMAVDVVHHGRETCFDDVDLTRTVGLCIYNINTLFDLEYADMPNSIVPLVKEQFRRVNHIMLGCAGDRSTFEANEYTEPWETIAAKMKGIPRADVCFNYHGQINVSSVHSSQFRPAPEPIGATGPGQNLETRPFYCSGIISDGQFELSWRYSEKLHRRSTIEHLVEVYMEALRSLIYKDF